MSAKSDQSSGILIQLESTLQKMLGLHRDLYELCKKEKVALSQPDTKEFAEITQNKSLLIEQIKLEETSRIRVTALLAESWECSYDLLTLSYIIKEVEPDNAPQAQKLQSVYQTLMLYIERTKELNQYNKEVIQTMLQHLQVMKTNVLGEVKPKNETYSSKGTKQNFSTGEAKLFSQEV